MTTEAALELLRGGDATGALALLGDTIPPKPGRYCAARCAWHDATRQ